jgi:hypothetical protein
VTAYGRIWVTPEGLRSDEAVEQEVAEMIAKPPLSEEETAKKLKEWEKVESLVKASGKKHWWE